MPLRDHFRPPADDITSWDALHGQWPGAIVSHLRRTLPPGFVAGPQIYLGTPVEVDIAMFEKIGSARQPRLEVGDGGTAVLAPPEPSLDVEIERPDDDEYEVRIYDSVRGRRLVATIEIVSPGNKDRPETRERFVSKCAALVARGVSVSIVDLVTIRTGNLYADLLKRLGHRDRTAVDDPSMLYAASCRWVPDMSRLQAWSYVLEVGQKMPTLPIWLSPDLHVMLDLEVSYEKACHDIWLT